MNTKATKLFFGMKNKGEQKCKVCGKTVSYKNALSVKYLKTYDWVNDGTDFSEGCICRTCHNKK